MAARHDQGDFEVSIVNEPCEGDPNSYCTVSISIHTSDKIVRVDKVGPNQAVLMLNGTTVMDSINYASHWFKSTLSPAGNVFIKVFEFQLEVVYRIKDSGFVIKYSSYTYGGKTQGLCGNCNGYKEDDFIQKNGISTYDIHEFGNSWATAKCSKPPAIPAVTECHNEDDLNTCDLLWGDSFASCHPLISPIDYIVSCKKAFCNQVNYTVCTSMAQYAESCFNFAGMCLKWRTSNNCLPSLKCLPGLIYKECTEACEETCNDVNNDFNDLSIYARNGFGGNSVDGCGSMLEPEGCYCPKNSVRNDKNQCVHVDECVSCFDSIGNPHTVGEEWSPNPCEKCHCSSSGVTSCSNIACSIVPCPVGHQAKSQQLPGQCCPSVTCVPIVKNCTVVSAPMCSQDYQLKRLVENDCPRYVCECIDPSECLPLEQSAKPLFDGEEFVEVDNGCCKHTQKSCNLKKCPSPTICPRHFNLKSVPGPCCPIYSCEHPLACIDGSNNLRQIGESWNENPCKHCICEQLAQNANPESICASETCRFEPLTESDKYVYTNVTDQNSCCPRQVITACKHLNGTVMPPRSTWSELVDQPDPNPTLCIVLVCSKKPEGLERGLLDMRTCPTSCPLGFRLQLNNDHEICRGCATCEPYACVSGDSMYEVNRIYKDGCINRSCQNINGSVSQYFIFEKIICSTIMFFSVNIV